jgi:hypothetical protein
MEKTSSGSRLRTCRGCGKKFEYPVKGSAASRHHCDECAVIPAEVRKVMERLSSRIAQLENQLRRLQTVTASSSLTSPTAPSPSASTT